ncbi:Mtc3p Ecym_2572 [Eremothecium cymbalariae DBVPG|uniref:Uncharacterized protein n=1 Tax=Eremothecium cymbalariae (strain CBS 270.75 / DBVPG 7215 / KCTC 17166 / NRRL Y-17582) TaxID=931890 RepID=G8JQD1_ERECY|nr:Hypothetical protein Ecym_2572 [Eremothecium cymbalariae DBVPG\
MIRYTLRNATRCSIHRTLSTTSYEPPDFKNLTASSWMQKETSIQEEITEYLDWRMTDSWKTLTPDEIKAAYVISYGEWGPRAPQGSKLAQVQMTGPEIILRVITSMVLFTALGIVVLNYKTDKKVSDKIEELRSKVL